MNMIIMAILLVVIYFSALITIVIFRDRIDTRVGNAIFVILDIIFFMALHRVYFNKGWFKTFLTLENISPLTFTLIPFTYLMSDKFKQWYFNLISFLSVGMFFAILVNPNYSYLFQHNLNASFEYAYDSISHLICSLFGVYLVLTKQVKVNFKSLLSAIINMFSIITIIVLINLFLHTGYLGMNPYGNYSIYMLKLFNTFGATLVAYYLGVLVVIILGFEVMYVVQYFMNKHDEIKQQ